ncbi:HAD-IIIC family phosphatase [Pelomonas sp. SE-A7]|uniref:HAD-IIIC family phosphatase n=1 Tax=Pelomonas sp. SE-A7 TaxID=3054953 RepID=UPI00259CEB95|nr:HAD-IIIC family phosphatase [Pelomonas sp. SE-A7]MDM4764889.1 HAD-IIIC family phosphatase [Pelomonas sp. SE-A7]
MTEAAARPAPAAPAARPEGRGQIQALLAEGRLQAAVEAARLLLNEQGTPLNQRFVRQQAQAVTTPGLKPFKLALLSSFSIEFIHDALIAQGFANGLAVEIYQSGFGQVRQEILNPASGLYAFAPDLTVLAVEGEDWLPELYAGFMDADPGSDQLAQATTRCRDEIAELARQFRSRASKPLLVHNFAQPAHRSAGIADGRLAASQQALLAGFNQGLAQALTEVVDCYVFDYAALVSQQGARHWYDARMRLYAKAPIASAMLGALSREYMKYARAFTGLSKKCLVLDLDNTLWGGVIGEDGLDGIQLGANYPGSAFVEFQRAVRSLAQRGVILALASKNNAADVDAVFAQHSFMQLKPEQFAASQVHWEPKAESLKRIASQLNIGLEHMVFVDDNPVECEQVRLELPMVTVIQLPKRPEAYVDALLEEGLFDTLGLSDEDRRRGALYQQRAQAESMRAASGGSLEDYYRSLDMVLNVAPVDAASMARTAQLTQKTNQFNLTTFRYSEADVAERMADEGWLLLTVGVRDRFGDNGIVGIVMAQQQGDRLEIDTFLLSCRVIGRTVETAMLAQLCEAAAQRGLARLSGQLRPTAKNQPARDLFERHGFSKQSEDAEGNSRWQLDLGISPIAFPDWFVRG